MLELPQDKEFLLEHGVPFVSVNVLDDEQGFRELEALGVRLVPIVARGDQWANGAVFRDVAKVAGFAYGGHKMLSPEQLKDKVLMILDAAAGYCSRSPTTSSTWCCLAARVHTGNWSIMCSISRKCFSTASNTTPPIHTKR